MLLILTPLLFQEILISVHIIINFTVMLIVVEVKVADFDSICGELAIVIEKFIFKYCSHTEHSYYSH